MPDGTDRSISVSSLSDVDSQVQSTPALSDISERDKPWDKHKANADCVTGHYSRSQFHRYAERVKLCADLLEFKLSPDSFEGAYKLKLASAHFCRVRHCPVCQWRRSLMWKAKAYKAIPKVVLDYPSHRWLFLTLTQKNVPVQELRKTLDSMNKAFIRLTKLTAFPGTGWIKSVEVTRGKDGNAHPHLHVLLMVSPSYFGRNYIKQDEWSELWQRCLRIDYTPMTHVRAIAKNQDPVVLVPEILKYQVKESDLIRDRVFFLELTKQLHKTRAVAVGGVLRDYMKELEEEPEDLIGESDEPEQVDEGSLYFGWKRREKRYRMVDS